MDDSAVRKQMLPLLPITLLGVAVDLWLRPTLDLRLTQWAWWGLSVAFSLVMWQGLFAISSRLRPRWQAAFVLVVGVVTARWLWCGLTSTRYFTAGQRLTRSCIRLAIHARLGGISSTKPIGGTRSSGWWWWFLSWGGGGTSCARPASRQNRSVESRTAEFSGLSIGAAFWPRCAWPGWWLLAQCIATRASWCRMRRPRSWPLTLPSTRSSAGCMGACCRRAARQRRRFTAARPWMPAHPTSSWCLGKASRLAAWTSTGTSGKPRPGWRRCARRGQRIGYRWKGPCPMPRRPRWRCRPC